MAPRSDKTKALVTGTALMLGGCVALVALVIPAVLSLDIEHASDVGMLGLLYGTLFWLGGMLLLAGWIRVKRSLDSSNTNQTK